jgi:hypothetical protein
MRLRGLIVAVTLVAFLGVTSTASAAQAQIDQPRNAKPAWFTKKFKKRVDRSGRRGVKAPKEEPSIFDVCPGVAVHNNAVGPGTCLVYPYGCTANFVYYNGGGATAPAVANGRLFLGTAGHCADRTGQPVYAAVSTPGVGPAIKRIGTVSKRVEKYGDDGVVQDFASIKLDNGIRVEPNSPVGGPQGIYDGCQSGTPLKFWGNGYEVAVAQGNPGGGAALHWYDSGYGWAGDAFGGDSGSGVMTASNQAAGNLTAVYIFDPSFAFFTGEVVGSRATWILSYLGGSYKQVNADYSLSRDTTNSCTTPTAGGAGALGL